MARDVELPHAESKIDRIEIFERAGKQRQVRREKDEDQQGAGRSRYSHSIG